jgi:hypothetical protein
VKKKVFGKRFEKRGEIDEISGNMKVFLILKYENGRNGSEN